MGGYMVATQEHVLVFKKYTQKDLGTLSAV